MGVFGRGRKRLDFTVIHQPWLRNATKQWVLEELPLRRGPNVVGVLRDHVNSIAVLGNSLRLQRPDEGMHPAEVGRADIVAFLNRLHHRESTGHISAYQRRKLAQHAALVLRECRAMGLTSRIDRWPGSAMNSPSGATTYHRPHRRRPRPGLARFGTRRPDRRPEPPGSLGGTRRAGRGPLLIDAGGGPRRSACCRGPASTRTMTANTR